MPPPGRALPLRIRLVVAVVVPLVLGGCAPEPASDRATAVKDLYDVFTVVASGVFVVVVGLIGWAILRYRAKPGDELPKQTRGNVKLEIVWFAIPQIIVVVLFVLSMLAQNKVNAEVEDPDVTIETVAFQWGWRFNYADHDVTISGTSEDPPEIVVPVDSELRFTLEASDVDHAFYIPKFLIKRDVIPGRTNQLDLSIEEPGVYEGLCAEFCGLLHDRMTFTVRAVEQDEFDDWVQEEQSDV